MVKDTNLILYTSVFKTKKAKHTMELGNSLQIILFFPQDMFWKSLAGVFIQEKKRQYRGLENI